MFYALKSIQLSFKSQFVETAQFDSNNDGKLGIQERINFLSSPEAKEIVKEKEVESLEISLQHLKENVNVSNGLDAVEVRVLQFTSHKILHLQGVPLPNGILDGLYGSGTRSDITAASGVEFTSKQVTQEHVDALVVKAESIIQEMRSSDSSDTTDTSEVESSAEEDENIGVVAFEGERNIQIKKGDTLGQSLINAGFSYEEQLNIINYMEEKVSGVIPGFQVSRIYEGDVFQFEYPENGSLSLTFTRNGSTPQYIALAGEKYNEGESLDKYSQGESL